MASVPDTWEPEGKSGHEQGSTVAYVGPLAPDGGLDGVVRPIEGDKDGVAEAREETTVLDGSIPGPHSGERREERGGR